MKSKATRKNKHGNRKTVVDGMTFDSAWEADRWQMLLKRFRAGKISGLSRQVSFKLRSATGKVICRYRADFVYIERGVRVVEDAKGHLTAMYKQKRKWMFADYGIKIRETFEKDPSTW